MRWSLVRHITGHYVKTMIDDENTDDQSKDKQHAALEAIDNILKQNEEHARIIEEHIVNNAANPFETDNSIEVLSNITTGEHVSIEIQNAQN